MTASSFSLRAKSPRLYPGVFEITRPLQGRRMMDHAHNGFSDLFCSSDTPSVIAAKLVALRVRFFRHNKKTSLAYADKRNRESSTCVGNGIFP